MVQKIRMSNREVEIHEKSIKIWSRITGVPDLVFKWERGAPRDHFDKDCSMTWVSIDVFYVFVISVVCVCLLRVAWCLIILHLHLGISFVFPRFPCFLVGKLLFFV